MLRTLKTLERYSISATDGELGSVTDFLLDDERWAVRYLIADTAGFLGGRPVLISPISFREVDWATRRFHVALSVDKVRKSPSVDVDKSVSRQHERDYLSYYNYPYYWGYAGVWGMASYPGQMATMPRTNPPAQSADLVHGDVHLRSAREVRGYEIQGSDGAIGHVEDFVVDDASWEIRYLVVDTSNWWFGKKVLVAPHWASHVSWDKRSVTVEMTRAAIKASPAWDPTTPVNREYESRLYDYHGRPAYWTAGAPPEPARSLLQNF